MPAVRTTMFAALSLLAVAGTAAADSGPCAGATWGAIGAPGPTVIHVSSLIGSDTLGHGTVASPYATVGAAVEAARVRVGPRVIALWPGSYNANIRLAPNQGWTDPVTVVGCSPDEVTLQAANPSLPVLETLVTVPVEIAGVTTAGGKNALSASGGANLSAGQMRVTGSKYSGVSIRDAATIAAFEDVIVSDTTADGGCGAGVAVRSGTLTFDGGGILHAKGAGFFGDGANIDIDTAFVFDTAVDSQGKFGRAIHTQGSTTTIADSYVSGSSDASIFLLNPILGDIHGVMIDITGAGVVAGQTTGDGIVVSGATAGHRVTVANNFVFSSARAGILIDNGEVELAGNLDYDSGAVAQYGSAWIAQHADELDGVDAADVMYLPGRSEAALDRSPMSCP